MIKKLVLSACVRHSQSVTTSPFKPWVDVKKMELLFAAGLGEVCSHMAALLFDEVHEALFRQLPNNTSRTSQSCV